MRICEVCSEKFNYPPGANHAGRYCSRICMAKGFSNQSEYSCGTCGIIVERIPSGVRKTVFCSHACYSQSMRGQVRGQNLHTLNCKYCEGEFQVKPYRVREAKFCSRKCATLSQRLPNTTDDTHFRATPEHKTWRKEVFDRDDYTCQSCGERGGELNADHIKSFRDHPALRLDLNNGRTLCVPCHRKTDNYGFRAWRPLASDAVGY